MDKNKLHEKLFEISKIETKITALAPQWKKNGHRIVNEGWVKCLGERFTEPQVSKLRIILDSQLLKENA